MREKTAAEEFISSWKQLMEQSEEQLTGFLASRSGLPGPRANLTLALEASRLVTSSWVKNRGFLRGLLMGWSSSGDEYLMFVAHTAFGHILVENPEEEGWVTPILYEANFSPLWRAREGVTFALEALLEGRRGFALGLIDTWCSTRDPTVIRNVVVALAHPQQVRSNTDQLEALKQYNDVGMALVAEAMDRTPGMELLAKSLGFTLSVAAEADEGYLEQIEEWIRRCLKPWRLILKENMGKARIKRKYPGRIAALLVLLG